MAKKNQNMFAGRTGRSMEKPKNAYGYLNLVEDLNIFKPEGGTEVVFDILPYKVTDPNHLDNKKYDEDAVVGNYWWKRPVKVHRDVGPEGVVIICPTTFGDKCPICEYAGQRRKAGADWDELKEIFPKDRSVFLINVIDSSECEVDYTEGEVHVMDQSDYLFLEALDDEIKRDIDNEGFPDPYDGLSIRVYFKAKKRGKFKYAEASKIDFEDREEQYDDHYLDTLPGLDDMLKVLSYSEIEALYMGMEGMDDEVDDEPERERRASRRTREKPASRRTRKPREEKEEVETIDDDPDPEEEKKEKPASRRTRKPAAKKPAATRTRKKQDPEESAEEPEEEKKPARRTRKSTVKDKCPHGFRFGIDTDQEDACDTCKIWDDCMDEKEGK